ncbi:recombinase family protein [Marinicaulis aureus]|uniref:Recombinase family protein n=1 Tax=Hyphococcus aureus TaxID=2666033 RepID=A0ABW1KTX7_9PROT
MTGKLIPCAIYTRKSTDEGLDQEFNSLDAQRESCEAYIRSQASQGWTIVKDRFDDGGFSGGNMDRPSLKDLIRQIKAGRIKVIVVYKIDRLTRSLADFARLVEVLDEHGASFVSVTQQFNTTTSMGRLTLNVLLSFAQFEREVTGERIRDKVAASKRRGMWMGGHPPLGYDIMNRRLAANETEAANVRTVFKMALEEKSLARLVDRLRKEGLSAKKWKTQTGKMMGGGALTRTTLNRLLRSPVYLGKVRQGGSLYDGEHEAIVDEALWTSVQHMLDDARQLKRSKTNGKSNALLSGLLHDDAGNRMVPSHSRRGKTVYRYYVSTPLVRGSKKPVGAVSRINASRVDGAVIAALEQAKLSSSDTDATTLMQHVKKITVHRDELEIQLKGSAGGPLLLRVPADLTSGKSADRLIQTDSANRRNEPLIKAVALGASWRSKLENGEHESVIALAKSEGYSERYVWKTLRLAFLAPDIVEAILDGRQPAHLTLRKLNDLPLDGDWGSQRRTLGFEPRA